MKSRGHRCRRRGLTAGESCGGVPCRCRGSCTLCSGEVGLAGVGRCSSGKWETRTARIAEGQGALAQHRNLICNDASGWVVFCLPQVLVHEVKEQRGSWKLRTSAHVTAPERGSRSPPAPLSGASEAPAALHARSSRVRRPSTAVDPVTIAAQVSGVAVQSQTAKRGSIFVGSRRGAASNIPWQSPEP